MSLASSTRGISPARFVPTLDGWRGVAILLVLAAHSLEPSDRTELTGLFDRAWHTMLFKVSPTAVSIFFALSGYLITTRLVMEESKTGSVNLSRFYLRRSFRILPPAGCYLLIIGVLSWLQIITVYQGELPSSLLFFRNYWHAGYWYTGHFWSLSVEEHFYLIWPLLFVLLGSRRGAWAGLALVAATILWRPFGSTIDLAVPLLHRTDLRADALFWPSALAIVLAANPHLRDRLREFLSVPVFLATVCVLGSVLLAAPRDVARTVESLLMPMVVLATALSPEGFFGKILEWAPLTWLGRISYSLYLWQQLFLHPGLPLLDIPLRIAGVFGFGCLSYYLVERPAIRLAKRLEDRMRDRAVPARTDTVPA